MVFSISKTMVTWYLIARTLNEAMKAKVSTNLLPERPIPDSDWIISIKRKLQAEKQRDLDDSRRMHSIYRIPNNLKYDTNKSCIPQSVSIGPYHNSRPELEPMECHKWWALYKMLERTKFDFRLFFDAVRRLEMKARRCYESDVFLSSNKFVEMMTLDGIFILELLKGDSEGFTKIRYRENDPICNILPTIKTDIMMLENQIPLFILDTLYGIQIEERSTIGKVVGLASKFFDGLITNGNESWQGNYGGDGPHLLGVFCQSLQGLLAAPSETDERLRVVNKPYQELIPCVSELKAVGIKLATTNALQFWDIKFTGKTLTIPMLLVCYNTHSLLLNLVAYEQCHRGTNFRITSYVMFMDKLINSPKDAAHLHHAQIIVNNLGSYSELVQVFNNICKEVLFGSSERHMSPVSADINKCHNKRRYNKYLKRTLCCLCKIAFSPVSVFNENYI